MKQNLPVALCGLVAGLAIAGIGGQLRAQATSAKCDYTYIDDDGSPSLGKNGQVSYNDNWRKVLNDGWTLKMAGADVGIYIFEKCR